MNQLHMQNIQRRIMLVLVWVIALAAFGTSVPSTAGDLAQVQAQIQFEYDYDLTETAIEVGETTELKITLKATGQADVVGFSVSFPGVSDSDDINVKVKHNTGFEIEEYPRRSLIFCSVTPGDPDGSNLVEQCRAEHLLIEGLIYNWDSSSQKTATLILSITPTSVGPIYINHRAFSCYIHADETWWPCSRAPYDRDTGNTLDQQRLWVTQQTVTVEKADQSCELKLVSISPDSLNLMVGESERVRARLDFNPSGCDASDVSFRWEVSPVSLGDFSDARDDNPSFTAMDAGKGEITVTASHNGVSDSYSINVNISSPPIPTPTPPPLPPITITSPVSASHSNVYDFSSVPSSIKNHALCIDDHIDDPECIYVSSDSEIELKAETENLSNLGATYKWVANSDVVSFDNPKAAKVKVKFADITNVTEIEISVTAKRGQDSTKDKIMIIVVPIFLVVRVANSCSGVIVNDSQGNSYVLTAAHCVQSNEKDKDGKLVLSMKSSPQIRIGSDSRIRDNGPTKVELVGIYEPADLALIEISESFTGATLGNGQKDLEVQAIGLPGYKHDNYSGASTGQLMVTESKIAGSEDCYFTRSYSVMRDGKPKGYQGQARKLTSTDGAPTDCLYSEHKRWRSQKDFTYGGNSGGPLISTTGELVGIISGSRVSRYSFANEVNQAIIDRLAKGLKVCYKDRSITRENWTLDHEVTLCTNAKIDTTPTAPEESAPIVVEVEDPAEELLIRDFRQLSEGRNPRVEIVLARPLLEGERIELHCGETSLATTIERMEEDDKIYESNVNCTKYSGSQVVITAKVEPSSTISKSIEAWVPCSIIKGIGDWFNIGNGQPCSETWVASTTPPVKEDGYQTVAEDPAEELWILDFRQLSKGRNPGVEIMLNRPLLKGEQIEFHCAETSLVTTTSLATTIEWMKEDENWQKKYETNVNCTKYSGSQVVITAKVETSSTILDSIEVWVPCSKIKGIGDWFNIWNGQPCSETWVASTTPHLEEFRYQFGDEFEVIETNILEVYKGTSIYRELETLLNLNRDVGAVVELVIALDEVGERYIFNGIINRLDKVILIGNLEEAVYLSSGFSRQLKNLGYEQGTESFNKAANVLLNILGKLAKNGVPLERNFLIEDLIDWIDANGEPGIIGITLNKKDEYQTGDDLEESRTNILEVYKGTSIYRELETFFNSNLGAVTALDKVGEQYFFDGMLRGMDEGYLKENLTEAIYLSQGLARQLQNDAGLKEGTTEYNAAADVVTFAVSGVAEENIPLSRNYLVSFEVLDNGQIAVYGILLNKEDAYQTGDEFEESITNILEVYKGTSIYGDLETFLTRDRDAVIALDEVGEQYFFDGMIKGMDEGYLKENLTEAIYLSQEFARQLQSDVGLKEGTPEYNAAADVLIFGIGELPGHGYLLDRNFGIDWRDVNGEPGIIGIILNNKEE